MKKILFFTTLLCLVFAGCNDQTDIPLTYGEEQQRKVLRILDGVWESPKLKDTLIFTRQYDTPVEFKANDYMNGPYTTYTAHGECEYIRHRYLEVFDHYQLYYYVSYGGSYLSLAYRGGDKDLETFASWYISVESAREIEFGYGTYYRRWPDR